MIIQVKLIALKIGCEKEEIYHMFSYNPPLM